MIAGVFTVPAYLDAVRGFASTSDARSFCLMTGDPGFNDLDVTPHTPGGGEFSTVRATEQARSSGAISGRLRIFASPSCARPTPPTSASTLERRASIRKVALGVGEPPTGTTSLHSGLSKDTGGRLVSGNDPAAAVHEFDTASSSFYSLGYAPAHPDDGKYHKISVRLKNPARTRSNTAPATATLPAATQLARAMTSPTAAAMQASALPVTLTMGTPESVRNEVTVPITVNVPFNALQFLPDKTGVSANLWSTFPSSMTPARTSWHRRFR